MRIHCAHNFPRTYVHGWLLTPFWPRLASFLSVRGCCFQVGGGQKGYSVAQIQLGLLGSARLVQRDLDKIAMSADTNSRNGLYSLMQDSVIALIRR